MIVGDLPKVAENFSRSADFISGTDNKKPARSGGSNKKENAPATAATANKVSPTPSHRDSMDEATNVARVKPV
jgi:hypothetical protein